jgi:mRNA-degrading endonuclease toxin of MazEF toxin-antitoxin module
VIVSTNGRNSHPRANTVLAIPLSILVHKPGPWHLLLRSVETGLPDDSVAWAESICVLRTDRLKETVTGHRPLTDSQVCRLAGLVQLAMGCVD